MSDLIETFELLNESIINSNTFAESFIPLVRFKKH